MTSLKKPAPLDFKTQYTLGFTSQDDEIVVDFFCGGGGAGTGLEMGLGRPVNVAKNHNPAAISMHEANHPHARHFQTDVFDGDPDEECQGKPVGWFHMSPDCTHHSQAAGGQPRKREIRNLSWIGLKWAGKKRPRVISLENVKQILQWGPLIAKRCKHTGRVVKLDGTVAMPGERVPVGQQFLVPDPKRKGQTWRRFVHLLRGMGYDVEWRVLKACDFGAPTSRERLFMIARCDGRPIVWPAPTHAAKPAKGQQPYRTAAECIDFTLPSQSIFDRKKPLADATMRRIAKGIQREVLHKAQPFIVPIANWSRDAVQPVDQPLNTVTAWPRGGSFALASPVLVGVGGRAGQTEPRPGDDLMYTITSKGDAAVATAFLAQANAGFNTTHSKPLSAPMTTVTNTGSQQQLVTAFLSRQFGASVGQGLDSPAPVITAGGGGKSALVELRLSPEAEQGALRCAAFLMKYHGIGENVIGMDEPVSTVTTKDRLALVTVWISGDPYVIVDIRLRMLQPHELYAAQGFPRGYRITHGHDGRRFTKSEQVHMCGNSVSPPPMAALAMANDPWREEQDEAIAA